jgi:2',3'-cyclic-nucleotide 2'-phosphodiesterase (5'-nucleotidase family)
MTLALLFIAAHDLTIVYAADRRAEVAPCHCDNNPLGGVDRQVAEVAALRKQGPVLVIDGGDNFFDTAEQSQNPDADARAELIADALAKIDPIVTLPGARDFLRGAQALRTLGIRAHATWLMSNVTSDHASMFTDHVIAKVGDQKILLLGFWSELTFPAEAKGEGYRLEDPIQAAQRLLQQYGKQVDLAIAIAHTGGQVEEQLGEKVPGLSLILSSHEGRLQFGARQSGSTQIVSAGHSGKYMIRLDVHYHAPAPTLEAGMDVQKFFRDLQTARDKNDKAAASALEAKDWFAQKDTLLFKLLPMSMDLTGAPDLYARARAIDAAGYDFSAQLAKQKK